MQGVIHLKADPNVFLESDNSPSSLHAQICWQQDNGAARKLAKDLSRDILISQEENGSWGNSVPTTIEELYILYLLGNNTNPKIEKAVGWLLETGRPAFRYNNSDGTSYDNLFFETSRGDTRKLRKMRNVPFTGGCSGFVKSGAALFLATLFRCGDDKRINLASRFRRTETPKCGYLGRVVATIVCTSLIIVFCRHCNMGF